MRRSSCVVCEAFGGPRPPAERGGGGGGGGSRPHCPPPPKAPSSSRRSGIRRVAPVPEEYHDVDASKKYWKKEIEKLERDVKGAGGLLPEEVWAALPAPVLGRVASVLQLPLPTLGANAMAEVEEVKSGVCYWSELPLPPEIDTINVTPMKGPSDWRFVENSDDESDYSDQTGVALPNWFKLSKATKSIIAISPVKEAENVTSTTSQARLSKITEETPADNMKGGVKDGKKYVQDKDGFEETEKHKDLQPVLDLQETEEQKRKVEKEEKDAEIMQREDTRRREKKISKITKSSSLPEADERELALSAELDRLGVDLEVHPASTCPRNTGHFNWPHMPRNPYYNFLKKSPEKAAIWRQPDRPKSSGEVMDTTVLLHPKFSLLEKANHITRAITTEFLAWVEGLGGVQRTDLNAEILQQLFDVTSDLPAARSLCVRVRELPVVTKEVADAAFAPQAETHEGLRLQVVEDAEVEGRARHAVAFGAALHRCCPQRFVPPRNDVRATWIDCGRTPEDIASAKQVFHGITNLQSVQKFCEFLERNPQLAVPPYLQSVGMVGLRGQAAERVRQRGGLHPRDRRQPPPPKRSAAQSRGGSLAGGRGRRRTLRALDTQVLLGHAAATVAKPSKYDRSNLL